MLYEKKSEEVLYLRQFRSFISDFPEGETLPDESPDFRILDRTLSVGIEITKLFKPAVDPARPEQAIESHNFEIVDDARILSELRGHPYLHVAVFFSREITRTKAERWELSRALAGCVHHNIPAVGESVELEWHPASGNLLPDGIDQVQISRDVDRRRSHWYWPKAGFVRSDAVGLIQDAIDSKTLKIGRYLEKVDSCWLLIVADGMKPSSMIRPDAASLEYKYSSPFERTYFMHSADQQATRLASVAE